MWIKLELLDMLMKMETLSSKKPPKSFTISTKRGRPTILLEELDPKIKSNDSKFKNGRGSYKHSCCTWCFCWDSKIKF